MRRLFVDASVLITLADIGHFDHLADLDGSVQVPGAVAAEVTDDPAASRLEDATDAGWLSVTDAADADATDGANEVIERSAAHLGVNSIEDGWSGDVALLAFGMATDDAVVVTDDGPLRSACKALGVDLSGSIGVLVAAVERGALGRDAAVDALYAMDESGARLSASLLRRAERLVDDAADDE